jgi:flagellar hook-associated protein 3 FlgL
MTLSGLGDRAALFAATRQNHGIRDRLSTLAQELGTGEAADPTRALGGDRARLSDIDRRLALAKDLGRASAEAGTRAALMTATLDQVDALRARLLDEAIAPAVTGSEVGRPTAAAAAESTFRDLVGLLNARLGGTALFAGAATDAMALAPAEDMLASLRAATAGAVTADEAAAAVAAWFDDPAGGFMTAGYGGAPTDLTRPLGEGGTVTLAARADDPALRGLLKAAALGALLTDAPPGMPEGEQAALLARSRDALLSVQAPLTELRAGLGTAERRAEEAQARHAASASAFAILRAETVGVDPAETATALEAVKLQLETHYAVAARLSSLHLVNFLR